MRKTTEIEKRIEKYKRKYEERKLENLCHVWNTTPYTSFLQGTSASLPFKTPLTVVSLITVIHYKVYLCFLSFCCCSIVFYLCLSFPAFS